MTAKKKRKPRAQTHGIEAPAIIGPDHVRDRAFVVEVPEGRSTKCVIAPSKGWRRLSPLEQAYLRGQLAGGAPKHDAAARFEAGKRYGEMFAVAQSSGRDSTDMDRISKSGGGASISDSQASCIRALITVEIRLLFGTISGVVGVHDSCKKLESLPRIVEIFAKYWSVRSDRVLRRSTH